MEQRRPIKRKPIEVFLPRSSTYKQQRELDAFVRYCVLRIEKELGPRESWTVRIATASPTSSSRGYTSHVISTHLGVVLEATGNGPDSELATWDAMCRIEQLLRERRGSISRGFAQRRVSRDE